MAAGRIATWIRERRVGLNFALAGLSLASAASQIATIVNGDVGVNGGHIFALVAELPVAALFASAGVIILFTRRSTDKSSGGEQTLVTGIRDTRPQRKPSNAVSGQKDATHEG